MNPSSRTFDKKGIAVRSMTRVILDFIHCRTVVVAAHKDSRIIDHGTGLLFEIEGDIICATAGHVVAPYSVDRIHIIASEKPSNLQMKPVDMAWLGDGRQTENDVAILRLPKEFSQIFPTRRFHSINDLEIDPRGLESDGAVACGAPESDHAEEPPKFHRFQTFTFLTSFNSGCEWTPPFGDVPLFEIPFPTEVVDGLTGKKMDLPPAYGMSGGGVWRVGLKTGGIWDPSSMRIVGLNTEFHKVARILYATRAFQLVSLLASHYETAKAKLDKEISWRI
jgi:hypothetical protein